MGYFTPKLLVAVALLSQDILFHMISGLRSHDGWHRGSCRAFWEVLPESK